MTAFAARWTGTPPGAERDAGPPQSSDEGVSLPWLPFLPLAAIPFIGTSPESLDRVIVGMELLFLLLAIRNPVYILAALALSELTIRNYFLTLPVGIMIAFSHMVRGVELGPKAKPMLIAATALVAVSALSTFVADASRLISYVRSIAPDMAVLFMIPAVIRTRKDLILIGQIVLGIAAVSAGIAIAQQFGGPRFLSVPHYTLVNVDLADWGTRSLGMDLNPILLTDHLMLLMLPALGLLLTRAISRWQTRIVVLLLVAAMTVALYFTQTRSWVPSAALAVAAMAVVLRGRRGRELLLLLLVAGVGFWYWTDLSGTRYSQGLDSDGSAAARPVLWSVAFAMAVDHPVLGVGFDRFKELSPEYAGQVDPETLRRQNAGEILGREGAHNDFLGVWAAFGTGGLALYVLLMVFTARNLVRVSTAARDPVLRGIALGCFGALIAFAVNSFFHNLLTSALSFWILAGVSVALVKLLPAADRRSSDVHNAVPSPMGA